MSDPEPHVRLAGLVKMCEFAPSEELKSVVQGIMKDPALKNDEWLREAMRVLSKKQGAEIYQEGPNLLPNPGFETAGPDGLPLGWKRRDYNQDAGNAGAQWEIVSGADQVHSGTNAVRCITHENGDTSLFADVPIKPHTQYRLSAWIKTHAFRGKASLNEHLGRAETEKVTERESKWVQVDHGVRLERQVTRQHQSAACRHGRQLL